MDNFAKCAAIAVVVMVAAGPAAWAQAYNPNPGTPGPYAATPGSSESGQTARQDMQGLTTYERAHQELRKAGYKDSHDWKRLANGWSAEAVRNDQNVHVVIGDNGQIQTLPGQ